jgi:effector-binding domain-containing protein
MAREVAMNVEQVELAPRWIVGVRQMVAVADLHAVFGTAFAAAAAGLAAQGLAPAGPPTAVYREASADKVDVTVGFPVARTVPASGDLVCEPLPSGPAVATVHSGRYEVLGATYGELTAWMVGAGLVAAPVMWEEYLAGPGNEPDPARWRTRIVFPIATS